MTTVEGCLDSDAVCVDQRAAETRFLRVEFRQRSCHINMHARRKLTQSALLTMCLSICVCLCLMASVGVEPDCVACNTTPMSCYVFNAILVFRNFVFFLVSVSLRLPSPLQALFLALALALVLSRLVLCVTQFQRPCVARTKIPAFLWWCGVSLQSLVFCTTQLQQPFCNTIQLCGLDSGCALVP